MRRVMGGFGLGLGKRIAAVVLGSAIVAGSILGAPLTAYATEAPDSQVRYAAVQLTARENADAGSAAVNTIPAQSKVYVLEEGDGWSLLNDGTYVRTELLTSSKSYVGYQWTSASVPDSAYERNIWSGEIHADAMYMDVCQAYIDDGYLVDYIISEQGTHYYAVDSRTAMGKVVQRLQQGDIVTIDGVTYVIDGEEFGNYNDASNAYDDWKRVGYQTMIQTCIPPYGGPIVFKYGHPVSE